MLAHQLMKFFNHPEGRERPKKLHLIKKAKELNSLMTNPNGFVQFWQSAFQNCLRVSDFGP